MQTATGTVREPHSTNLGPAVKFSVPPKGLEEGVLHVQWLHIPPETRGGWGQDGPLPEQILRKWAGMGSERWSVYNTDLAQI